MQPNTLEICAQADVVVASDPISLDGNHATEKVSTVCLREKVGEPHRAEDREGEVFINLAHAGRFTDDRVVLVVRAVALRASANVVGVTRHVSGLPPVNNEQRGCGAEQPVIDRLPFVGMSGRADNDKNKKCSFHVGEG